MLANVTSALVFLAVAVIPAASRLPYPYGKLTLSNVSVCTYSSVVVIVAKGKNGSTMQLTKSIYF